jgi:hypothetical protein
MAVSVLPTGSDPQDARPASRVTAEAVDDRLVQGLKVFGPGRVQAQGESAADQKAPVVDDTLGLNPALARKARTFDDASYFIVPGNDAVALVDGRGTGIVDDVDHALSGEGLTVQDCATNGTQVRVVGLLPNGATNPTIIAADGSPRSLEVINNVYVALFDRTAAALPQTLEFQFDGQDRRVAVPIPSDLLDANCMKSPPGAPVPPGTAG